MITKTFEIRDEGTFIPVLAVKLLPDCEADRFLLASAGYGRTPDIQSAYILVCQLAGGEGQCTSDPYKWHGMGRTMQHAHQFIREHFDDLKSGAVIDVQFILGETRVLKESEALEMGVDL